MRNAVNRLSIAVFASAVVLYGILVHGYSTLKSLPSASRSPMTVDLNWYPPSATWITNLASVINGSGTYGMLFDGSKPPEHGQYSYCLMEHIRSLYYVTPPDTFELLYTEVVSCSLINMVYLGSRLWTSTYSRTLQVHRHHKRTPYTSNGFPMEPLPWDCKDSPPYSDPATYWSIYTLPSNPFQQQGLHGSCLFPQITKGGSDDSFVHGRDLREVYGEHSPKDISFRVTNNIITTQVAKKVIDGLLPHRGTIPLHVQPSSIDSLEPLYPCQKAQNLYNSFGPGSNNTTWKAHLDAAQTLYASLDEILGVSPSDDGFHMSFDHYFDNLSSKQCHERPLPCSISNATKCITQEMADAVYRIGQWEYSWIYRGAPDSLAASVASYGVWFAELAQNIRDAVDGKIGPVYRHNVAHDGSISRILSVLQVNIMMWPGMGAEVVFEVYRNMEKDGKYAIRILWSGSPLQSSSPTLGLIDMIDLDVFLSYVDGLVGVSARKIPQLCSIS
jgi:2-phosphoxylose phosphatase